MKVFRLGQYAPGNKTVFCLIVIKGEPTIVYRSDEESHAEIKAVRYLEAYVKRRTDDVIVRMYVNFSPCNSPPQRQNQETKAKCCTQILAFIKGHKKVKLTIYYVNDYYLSDCVVDLQQTNRRGLNALIKQGVAIKKFRASPDQVSTMTEQTNPRLYTTQNQPGEVAELEQVECEPNAINVGNFL